MECLSHPGRLLLDHLRSVTQIGMNIYESKRGLNLPFNDKDIRIALSNMLFYHDIGKSTKFFQEYLAASAQNQLYKGKSELKDHALISAVYAAYKTYIDLENSDAVSVFPIVVFLAIRKHHGDFENINDMLAISNRCWHNLKIQWDNLRFDCIGMVNRLKFDDAKEYIKFDMQDIVQSSDNYFLLNFFFSILTYSDKNDAKFHHQIVCETLPKYSLSWVDRYKTAKFVHSDSASELNIARNQIYKLSAAAIHKGDNHNIFSINVPTGSGKTLAGINAALKILGIDNSMRRIIYALPFTSIVEQVYKEICDIIKYNGVDHEDYITKHHHLAEVKIKDNENDYSGQDAQFLIENWDKPIIVTTFWQFFNTIIGNQNKIMRKFHNISNSIIILDEIQTMSIEYWDLIKTVLAKLVDIFNCKIIFMTATMPAIFSEKNGEIFPLIHSKKTSNFFGKFSRYKVETINDVEPISIDGFFDIAAKHISCKPNDSFLFVFNTIQSSLNFYERLTKQTNEHIIYLSGNIIPKDRLDRIKQIKNQSGRKIIVSTQLIEAGVDIDIDVIYRDFAPFDSIVQTAGRCNRNNRLDKLGQVFVVKLIDSKNNKKYCNYIYSPAALGLTDNLLKKYPKIEEGRLLSVIKAYYAEIADKSSSDKSTSLISDIQNLNYANIADKFNLIENIPDTLVFVEKNKAASYILEQFKYILKIEDRWKRKDEFLKIKKDFYSYVISVKIAKKNVEILSNLIDFGSFKAATKDMVDTFYDNDIGLRYKFDNFI